jgi:hypothetical protein
MSGAYSQNEIEVTPEMIEAGLNAYDAWYAASDNGPVTPLVVAVFRAMTQVRYIRVLNTPPIILGKSDQGP